MEVGGEFLLFPFPLLSTIFDSDVTFSRNQKAFLPKQNYSFSAIRLTNMSDA